MPESKRTTPKGTKPKSKGKGGRSAKKRKEVFVPFPEDLTQEEVNFFEVHSGLGMFELPILLTSIRGPKMLGIATLISISLSRKGKRLTPQEVMKANKYRLDMEGVVDAAEADLAVMKSEGLRNPSAVEFPTPPQNFGDDEEE